MISIRTDAKLKKFQEMLENGDKLLTEGVRNAMEISVKQVEGKVKRNPKTPVKTGTLRRSITSTVKGNSINSIKGHVGTNVPYAGIHEYGGSVTRTSAFGRPTKAFTVIYKERRYLRSSLDDSRKDIDKIFENEIDKVLTKALQ